MHIIASFSCQSQVSRPGLTDEDLAQIKEAFDLFDSDGNGLFSKNDTYHAISLILSMENTYVKANSFLLLNLNVGAISKDELYAAMESLGVQSRGTVSQLMRKFDVNKSGDIQFDEFVDMMTGKLVWREKISVFVCSRLFPSY